MNPMQPANSLTQGQQNSLNFLNAQNAPQQQDGSGGNFLERLLPTIGGIGGGILGTFVEPVGGSIAGAAAGSALGQQLENTLSGSKGSTLGAGLMGGVGQIAGLGIGKALGSVGGALGNFAAKNEGNVAQAIDNAPWQGIAGKATAKNLTPTLEAMRGYGIDTTPANLAEATSKITGQEGAVLSDLVRGGMAKSTNPVDLTGTVDLANNIAASPELATAGTTVGKTFQNSVNKILGLGEPGLKTQNAAPDIYEARQLFMRKAYDPKTPDVLASAYHDVAQSLDTALTKSGVDSAVAEQGLSPEQYQTLAAISPRLADEAAVAAKQGVGALRALQSPFVNANNLSKAAIEFAGKQLPGSIEAMAAQAGAGASGQAVPDVAQAAIGLAHPGLGKLAGLLSRIAPFTAKPAGQVLTSPAVGAGATVLGQVGAHLPALGQDANAPLTNAINPQQGVPAMSPNALPAANPDIEKAIMAAGLGGHSDIVGALQPFLQSQQQASVAAPLLQQLESSYSAAGGGQGFGGGLLDQLSSLIPGTKAYQYNQEKAALATALAKATGTDAGSILRMLPSLMSDQAGAQSQFGTLQSSLGQSLAPSVLSSL